MNEKKKSFHLWQQFHSFLRLILFSISFVYGRFFIPCPGLFHSFMAGFSFCISSLPCIISLIYGRFFIPCLILSLAYFNYLWQLFHSTSHPCPGFFIDLWHIVHILPHPCPVLFHYFMAAFSFLLSGLFHLFMAAFSFLCLIFDLDYFILLLQVFHSVFHPYPGLFHYLMADFSFCISSLPWIISFIYGIFFIFLPHPSSGLFHYLMFFIPCLILVLANFIPFWQEWVTNRYFMISL